MKKLLLLGAAAVALWTQTAGAFTYTDNNLLLIFREDGFNDVEFNLGTVSNYLGLANGTVITVTNFDLNLVTSNFASSDLSNVKFILIAAASLTDTANAYVTDADAGVPNPLNLNIGPWKLLRKNISFVGTQAALATATNASESYQVDPTANSAYDYIASSGGTLDISSISGSAASGTTPPTPFSVENAIAESTTPTVSPFFRLQGGISPGTPALQIGSFAVSTSGTLTFTAGTGVVLTPPANITIVRVGNVNSISFNNSISGANYRLVYTDSAGLSTPISSWTTLPSTPGNGGPLTLQDTTSDANRFYAVQVF